LVTPLPEHPLLRLARTCESFALTYRDKALETEALAATLAGHHAAPDCVASCWHAAAALWESAAAMLAAQGVGTAGMNARVRAMRDNARRAVESGAAAARAEVQS
jgi:hypothetical protein